MNQLLEDEIKWINDNSSRYDSDLHKQAVIKNIEKRYLIKELESRLAQYENPKNWTRPFNNEGKLINEHALYRPKLKDT